MYPAILRQLLSQQDNNLTPWGPSFLLQDHALEPRFSWFTKRTSIPQEGVQTLRTIVSRAGFKEYLEVMERVADLILSMLHPNVYPIYIIGFAFTRNRIKQLKVYYTLYIFKSQEDIMGTINEKLAKEAVMAILNELGLDEQKPKVSKLIQEMQAKRYTVAFIGLNIEKRKKTSLKIYFKSPSENQET